MKTYKATDSFTMKNNQQVFIVFSEVGSPDPVKGETIVIDGVEKVVAKVDRMSRCVCGKCGLQNNLGILTE